MSSGNEHSLSPQRHRCDEEELFLSDGSEFARIEECGTVGGSLSCNRVDFHHVKLNRFDFNNVDFAQPNNYEAGEELENLHSHNSPINSFSVPSTLSSSGSKSSLQNSGSSLTNSLSKNLSKSQSRDTDSPSNAKREIGEFLHPAVAAASTSSPSRRRSRPSNLHYDTQSHLHQYEHGGRGGGSNHGDPFDFSPSPSFSGNSHSISIARSSSPRNTVSSNPISFGPPTLSTTPHTQSVSSPRASSPVSYSSPKSNSSFANGKGDDGLKVKPSFFTIQPIVEEETEQPQTTSVLSMISGWSQENTLETERILNNLLLRNSASTSSPSSSNSSGSTRSTTSSTSPKSPVSPGLQKSPKSFIETDKPLQKEDIKTAPYSTYLTPTSRNKFNEVRQKRKRSLDKGSPSSSSQHHVSPLPTAERNLFDEVEDVQTTTNEDSNRESKQQQNRVRKRANSPSQAYSSSDALFNSDRITPAKKRRRLVKNIYSNEVRMDQHSNTEKEISATTFKLPRMPPKHQIDLTPISIYLPDKQCFQYLVNTPLPHTPRVVPFTQLLAHYLSTETLAHDSLRLKSYNILPNISKLMKKFHDSKYLKFLKRYSMKEYRLNHLKNEFFKNDESCSFISERDGTMNHSIDHNGEESIFEHFDQPSTSDDEINILNGSCEEISSHLDFEEMFSDEESASDDSDDDSEDDNLLNGYSIYGIHEDAPMFPFLWPHIKLITSGTLKATEDLINKDHRVALHFSGGRHHARKDRAAGFCYVNDIVLAALQLSKKRKKVFIVDIDIHHGDGTQHAFYYSSQVLTMSFHQYGAGLYPGTGFYDEIGEGKGKGYNINVPLKDGISDANFVELFKVLVSRAVEVFIPDYIIFVCGADALARDEMGVGNLTTRAYESCSLFLVDILKRYSHMKLLVTGAGGYNHPDTVRVWSVVAAAFCTSRPNSLPPQIPEFSNFHLFLPDFELHTTAERVSDHNTPEYLTEVRKVALDNLDSIEKR